MSTAYSAASVIIPAQGGGGKAGTLYGWRPDVNQLQDFTVQRNTTASRVNEAGLIEFVGVNVPRFDWGEGGSCPSLLVETARTNLLLRSEEFDDAAWFKLSATITANDATAPDGTTTADKLTFDAVFGFHIISQAVSMTSGTTYTQSYFVKNNDQNFIQIYTAGTSMAFSNYVNFDLTSGTISASSGMSGTIQTLTNGWYKITATRTAGANGTGVLGISGIPTSTSGYRPTYTASGESVFIWGAQLEEGSYPTSYIKTVASQETRNADVISKTGIASLIGQTEGTLYAEVDLKKLPKSITGVAIYLCNSIDGADSRVAIGVRSSGEYVAQLGGTIIASGTATSGIHKMAFGYDAAVGIKLFVDGALVAESTGPTTVIPITVATLGGRPSGSNIIDDHIKAAALYKTRLTNDELAALTTL